MDKIEEHLLKWYNHNKYKRLGSDVSVTELMRPPRIVHLMDRHRPKVAVTDPNKIIPALTGNGLHDQIQRYLKQESMVSGAWQIERKMLCVVNGTRVAGRFDALYNEEDLYDIKSTGTYKFEKGDYEEWEEQLNIYDYMLWKDGIELKSLKIMMICSNWSPAKLWKARYPQQRIQVIPMNRWSRSEQTNYMLSRVAAWKSSGSLSDNNLPLCSQKDRWGKRVYKLFRLKNGKRSIKNFDYKDRATAYLKACQKKDPIKWKEGHIRKEWSNVWKRCDYCDASPWCNQYANKLEP